MLTPPWFACVTLRNHLSPSPGQNSVPRGPAADRRLLLEVGGLVDPSCSTAEPVGFLDGTFAMVGMRALA